MVTVTRILQSSVKGELRNRGPALVVKTVPAAVPELDPGIWAWIQLPSSVHPAGGQQVVAQVAATIWKTT